MSPELMNIIYSAIGIIITGLASFAVAKITQLINSKIADKKAARYLETITQLVFNCVTEVYQTYVETLKKEGKFDKEAQEKALQMCLDKIKSKLAPELLDYIGSNFGDITEYLKSLIESLIYTFKR